MCATFWRNILKALADISPYPNVFDTGINQFIQGEPHKKL